MQNNCSVKVKRIISSYVFDSILVYLEKNWKALTLKQSSITNGISVI